MFYHMTGKSSSIPAGLAVGTGCSIGITLAGSIILSVLLDREIIDWRMSGYIIMILLTVSSFFGGRISYNMIRHQKLVICMMAGTLYFGLLMLITLLCFGGKFEALWETALLVSGSSLCAAMYDSTKKQRNHYKHIRK